MIPTDLQLVPTEHGTSTAQVRQIASNTTGVGNAATAMPVGVLHNGILS